VDARARYDEIADDLVARNSDVEIGQMMGMPCIKRGGKLVAGFARDEDAMVFKLPDEEARERALALGGAHLFDPSRRGRPMAKWVAVPPAHEQLWPELAQAALTPSG
jgi:hypothetical protein